MTSKKDFFSKVVAPQIAPIPTYADIAREYLGLKANFGDLVTQDYYCEVKDITRVTLWKYIRQYQAEQALKK